MVRVRERPLPVLVGPSGSGESSLLHAGLILPNLCTFHRPLRHTPSDDGEARPLPSARHLRPGAVRATRPSTRPGCGCTSCCTRTGAAPMRASPG
nr:hypothetical protein [Streptomyces rimosus]